MFLKQFLIATVIAVVPSMALAQSSPREACMGDIKTFCGSVQRDEIKNCIKEHHAQLSTACKLAIFDRSMQHH